MERLLRWICEHIHNGGRWLKGRNWMYLGKEKECRVCGRRYKVRWYETA